MNINEDNIRDSRFYGERIGDMDKEGLLKVIEHLHRDAENAREDHMKALDRWEDFMKECRK